MILTASIWITFGRLLGADFVFWDDHIHVFQNPYLSRLDSANIAHFWTHQYDGMYIPLSYMLFALLTSVARLPRHDPTITSTGALLNPHFFHAASLVLHTFNSLIVFAVLRLVVPLAMRRAGSVGNGSDAGVGTSSQPSPWKGEGARGGATLHSSLLTFHYADGPALVGALLFAVHPLQVESVAWISELRGMLSEFFCLLAMYGYLTSVAADSEFLRVPVRRPAYWMALLFYVCALLSKPAAAALPFALLALDRCAIRRPLRTALMTIAPWLILPLPSIYITHIVQPLMPNVATAWWTRPFIAGDALAFYLCKLFAPIGLTIDYGRRPSVVAGHWWGYVTWMLPVLAGVIIYRYRGKSPLAAVGGLVSVAMLVSVLGFVPFAFQLYSTVTDRYVYLALLGPALLVAGLMTHDRIAGGARRMVMGYGIAGVALFALACASAVQCGHWMNTDALFSNAVRRNPTSYIMLVSYAVTLTEEGRPNEAIVQYERAIRLRPAVPDACVDLATIYRKLGRADKARDVLLASIALAPEYAETHLDLGLLYLEQGNAVAGSAQIEQALRLSPNYARAIKADKIARSMLQQSGHPIR